MNFASYFSRPGAETLVEFGRALGRSHDQLRQWRYSNGKEYCRKPNPQTAADCERVSDGLMTCEELRPDLVWHRVADPLWQWHRLGRPCLDVTRKVSA